MAQIETNLRRKRIPTGTSAVPLPTESPELAAKTQALGRGADIASDFAVKFALRERDNQLTNFEGVATEGYNKFISELPKNPDPTSYPAQYQEFIKSIPTDSFRSPETKRVAQKWLKKKGGVWEKQVLAMADSRSKRNTMDAIALAEFRSIQFRDPEIINWAVTRGVKSGVITEDAGSLVIEKTHYGIMLGLIEDEAQEISETEGYEKAVKWVMSQKIELDEKNAILSEMASIERMRTTLHKQAQEKANTTMLSDYWDGKLTDPQIVTDALRAGYIDDTDAKYLRDAIMNPDPPKNTNEALIATRYAIKGQGEGTHEIEDVLKILIKYSQQLDPDTGKAFIKEIFGEHDTKNAFWNRQAHEYMDKQIMEVATLTGILYGSGEQLALSAQALMAYEEAKKSAITKDKPLNGRELLELAHEVMLPFREQAKPLIEGEELPEELIPKGTPPPISTESRPAIRYTKEGKAIINSMVQPKSVSEFLDVYKLIPDKEARKRYYEKWADEVYK